MQKMRLTLLALVLVPFLTIAYAVGEPATLLQDKEEVVLGRVISVTDEVIKDVPNTETKALYQTIVVRLLEGEMLNKDITITDTSFPMKVGNRVYVRHITSDDGSHYYSVQEPYRIPALLFILFVFFIAILLFGGKQGLLALIGLFISFGVIFNLLFPQILHGGNVIIISTAGALLALFVVMYTTHGFTRLTTSAFLGCVTSVFVTLFLAMIAVKITALTGFSEEESVFLNMATKGNLDFVALLVGGILIGVIGVIDDVAITQASVVHELRHANPSLTSARLYAKALSVGRNHMGAVINTLILAYTGASLPLVLLLYVSDAPIIQLINREAITTEIVRSSVGSIGLLCAVPLTTLIAVVLMKGDVYITTTSKESSHSHQH